MDVQSIRFLQLCGRELHNYHGKNREQTGRYARIKELFNSNPIKSEGLRHLPEVQRSAAQIRRGSVINQNFVQAPLAQFNSSQNKKRPPLKMEPSIDDSLAAVENIMRDSWFSVKESIGIVGAIV